MKFVDVIVPVPLDGTFTYELAPEQEALAKVGVRVVVPFGKNKTHTGIVLRIHDTKPDVETKRVIAVLDQTAVVTATQLRLWQWIADYYLSPIGDVMKAALPAGLKAEDGYKPRTELYVGLSPRFRQEQALHLALDALRRATKQLEAMVCFLQLSHWDRLAGSEPQQAIVEVTREELLNSAHATTTTVKALVDKGFLYTYIKEVGRLNNGGDAHPENIKPLNEAQQEAYERILLLQEHVNKGGAMRISPVTLLHGVTSSGKTEIYIHLIQRAIDQGQQVLYLLPEIALTVQMMQRLRNVFGNRLGIYHSKYSDAERVEIWQKQLSGTPYDVILGARSAVFLPFQRLGLVIVDEEHETSFKQQDPAPRYHARSAAIMLSGMYPDSRVVLGTATPSAESYYNAHRVGKYNYVSLTRRYKDIALPHIEVVDIKDLQRRKMMNGPFSPTLIAAIREALDNGEQAILFQNRRGFAPMLECHTCGWVPKCENCDVSLTLHKTMNMLTCHYCGYTYRVPEACPCCEEKDLRPRGYGTEKIEDIVRNLFPEARVARMDLDTTRTRNAYERLIGDFASGRTNVLIGTQMISKGLDFDHVSVVGILNADSMLNQPDFRAYEHAFMLMSQVAGRAGRKGHQGRVILQTKSPELPVIGQVVRNDYSGFFRDLLEERQAFNYPPFTHVVYVYLKHKDDRLVESAAVELAYRLRSLFINRVLGPDKPAVARVKQLHIRKLILKLETSLDYSIVRSHLRRIQAALLQDQRYKTLQIYYDVDPL